MRLICVYLVLGCAVAGADDWPQAAGPNHNFNVDGDAPESFSVSENQHVVWRTPLPSTGQGTAIVSNGRVFVTSHESIDKNTEVGKDMLGMCFDAKSGKELWRRTIPGTRVTDLSSLFSDNTAASPVADGQRVCFVNVGGGIKCFDYDGNEIWSYQWVPFGRHHARLHEPILYDGNVITVQYPGTDLQPEHTTKSGAKPLGRGREYWTHLQAFDIKTGDRKWIAKAGTSIHQTSLFGLRSDGGGAILTGRGGGHQPPEEPYGLSLVNAGTGESYWDTAISKFPSAQNGCWDKEHCYGFVGKDLITLDATSGKVLRRTSLVENVAVSKHTDDGWVRVEQTDLTFKKFLITKNSNAIAGRYLYFRSGTKFMIGRVHLDTGKVEYLQVPVQVVRHPGKPERTLWSDALVNDMKNSAGFVASQDKRNAGTGWGHVSAASPIVVGDKMYLPTMLGMVYVLRHDAERLDENALLSVSDLGPASETWSLSSLSYAGNRIFARTLKELICIGVQ